MFKSLKELIDTRLGDLIVLDSFDDGNDIYLFVEKNYLTTAIFFLKNDPDTRLTLLDQIFILEGNYFPWQEKEEKYILYQLKSLRLPYKIILCVKVSLKESISSIAHLYLGARWLEEDIKNKYGYIFEEDF